MKTTAKLPIGVFDSGIGGLTVLNALKSAMPNESFLYLGDTARLPYGTKGKDTVIKYASQTCQLLVERGVKCLVIACNTATALALEPIQKQFPELPVIGVVNPGATAAVNASKTQSIAVIATEATVNAKAYQLAIKALSPKSHVYAESCRLFVALAEEGWTDGPIVEAIAKEYLNPLLAHDDNIDTLVLGCTHFPVLADAIRNAINPKITVVDSAVTTALATKKILQETDLLSQSNHSTMTYFVTDDASRFSILAKRFLGLEVSLADIEHVELNGNGRK